MDTKSLFSILIIITILLIFNIVINRSKKCQDKKNTNNIKKQSNKVIEKSKTPNIIPIRFSTFIKTKFIHL